MQNVLLLTEQEMEELKRDIIDEIHDFSKKPCGFKMVSRDTGEEITDILQVRGMLFHPVEKAFGYSQDEKLQAQLRWARAARGEE